MLNNIILQTDSYKVSHYKQYPPKTEIVFSYLEARKRDCEEQKVLFFGIQYILKKYLVGEQITEEKIKQAKSIFEEHLGPGVFNENGWVSLLKKHNGILPIEIKAVREGSLNERGDVLVTVQKPKKRNEMKVTNPI